MLFNSPSVTRHLNYREASSSGPGDPADPWSHPWHNQLTVPRGLGPAAFPTQPHLTPSALPVSCYVAAEVFVPQTLQKHCFPVPTSQRVTSSLQTQVNVTYFGKWVPIQDQLQLFRPSSPEDPAFSFLALTSVCDHGGSELQETEPILMITVPSDLYRWVLEETLEEHRMNE